MAHEPTLTTARMQEVGEAGVIAEVANVESNQVADYPSV